MSDDALRPNEARVTVDDDEERRRARIYAARVRGDMCGRCGRTLAADEPVWRTSMPLNVAYGRASHRWGLVCRECASPEALRDTEGRDPERCVGCGRGVYSHSVHPRRRRVTCSRRCAVREFSVRRKEGTSS